MNEVECEMVFTGVGRHVPYGVGQRTLVDLEGQRHKTKTKYITQICKCLELKSNQCMVLPIKHVKNSICDI